MRERHLVRERQVSSADMPPACLSIEQAVGRRVAVAPFLAVVCFVPV